MTENHLTFEILRTIGAWLGGAVTVCGVAFVYISGRNKERRDRRLAALEDALAELHRVANGTDKAMSLAQRLMERRKLIPAGEIFEMREAVAQQPDSALWLHVNLLGLLGADACAEAIKNFHNAQTGLFAMLGRDSQAFEHDLMRAWGEEYDAFRAALETIENAHHATEKAGWRETWADWLGRA